MANDRITQLGDFRLGLREYEDPTKAPVGSARKMVNALISDKGGITKRPGVTLLGPYSSTAAYCSGFKVFKKSDSVTEIPVRALSTGKLEYYSPVTLTWTLLTGGGIDRTYTAGSNFGFTMGFPRSENLDYLFGGNKYENDFYWTGFCSKTTAAATAGATSLYIQSVFRDDIYQTRTASASDATTLTVPANIWVVDQWIDFYCYIKTGALAGKVFKITDSAENSLTCNFGSDPGLVDFEIRYSDMPNSGNLIVGNQYVNYSNIVEHNKLTVAALASDVAEGEPVTLEIIDTAGNPKGNRHELFLGRRYVANVRSGLSRNSSGNLRGAAHPGSVFVSKVVDGLHLTNSLNDFTFSSPRAAGEGDIIASFYGGSGHTDIAATRSAVYMYKPYSIESVKYSQDADDLANIAQVSGSYGSIMRVIKAKDDTYFITSDKQFTSIGIVENKGEKELSTNIGLPVKRLLQSYSYDVNALGAYFQNRIHIPVKAASTDSATNRLLVYNLNGMFEGEWWLNVDAMDVYSNALYASSSANANVYKLYDGLNDVLGSSTRDTQSYPITFEWLSNWHNPASLPFNQNEVNCFACEGYIMGNTRLTFNLYKNLSTQAFLTFDFAGTDETVDADISSRFLGSLPLGVEPIGAISSSVENDGMRHFLFMVYFPFEHGEEFSWGVRNEGLDQKFEIIRAGMNPSLDTITDFGNKIKEL